MQPQAHKSKETNHGTEPGAGGSVAALASSVPASKPCCGLTKRSDQVSPGFPPWTFLHEAGVVQILLSERGLMSDHEHSARKAQAHTRGQASARLVLCGTGDCLCLRSFMIST